MNDTKRMFISDISGERPHKDRATAQQVIMLAVGEMSLWRDAGRLLQPSSRITFVEFSELSPEYLQAVVPEFVVSNVISRSFDCLDLAQLLYSADFLGRYRIIDYDVPDPRLVLHEINALCPGLDVDVVSLARAQALRPI